MPFNLPLGCSIDDLSGPSIRSLSVESDHREDDREYDRNDLPQTDWGITRTIGGTHEVLTNAEPSIPTAIGSGRDGSDDLLPVPVLDEPLREHRRDLEVIAPNLGNGGEARESTSVSVVTRAATLAAGNANQPSTHIRRCGDDRFPAREGQTAAGASVATPKGTTAKLSTQP